MEEREVVKVACPLVPGNPDGFYLKYRDEMLPGEKIFGEAPIVEEPAIKPKGRK